MRRTITRNRTAAQILWRRRLAAAAAAATAVASTQGVYVRVYTACASGSVTWNARVTMAAARGSGAGRGRSEGRGRDRRRPVSGVWFVQLCMWVGGEVDKAKLHMLRGRMREGTREKWGCELGWCGFGEGSVHGLHMCGIKGEGLGVVGFSHLGTVLGRRWTGGGGVRVEWWGLERRLRRILDLETIGRVLELGCRVLLDEGRRGYRGCGEKVGMVVHSEEGSSICTHICTMLVVSHLKVLWCWGYGVESRAWDWGF